MPFGILVTFKTLKDIETWRNACFSGRFGRRARTRAGTAHEQQRLDIAARTLQVGDECGVVYATGVTLPFNFYRTRNASDPIEFGSSADVNQSRGSVQLQQLGSFFGRECAGVGQALIAGAFAGNSKNVF